VHYSGFTDFLKGADCEKGLFLKGKSKEDFLEALKNFKEGFLPYFAYNYLLFPALAGPFFWKVAVGNFCSEVICNTWMAAVNLGNHLGGDVELLLPDEEPKDRKQYLLKTIRCCNDFPLPRLVDFHTGGLNYHLAHHLAPKLPPNRLKGLTRKIKGLCKEYKVQYNEKGLIRSAGSSLGKLLYFALPLS
jgi:fatty acid desaturase